MFSRFIVNTIDSLNDSTINPKLRTLKLFKSEFKLEQYISQSQNIKHTQALFRFRISSHNLHIETDRYTQPKTPADLRKCIYCNADAVEDETHLLLTGADPGILVRGGVKLAGSTDRQNLFFTFIYFINLITFRYTKLRYLNSSYSGVFKKWSAVFVRCIVPEIHFCF